MKRTIQRLAAFAFCVFLTGCDAAKQTAAEALMHPPASKKSLQACEEWTLSDQSKIYSSLEVVETGDLSYGSLVLQRSAPQPLKSLEFTLTDPQSGQPIGEWTPISVAATDGASQTFRQPLSAPEGTKVILRVQVGDQPEVLTPWTLTFGEK